MRQGPTRSMIAAITGSDFFRWLIADRWFVLRIVACSSLDGEASLTQQANKGRINRSGHRIIGLSKGGLHSDDPMPDGPMTQSSLLASLLLGDVADHG